MLNGGISPATLHVGQSFRNVCIPVNWLIVYIRLLMWQLLWLYQNWVLTILWQSSGSLGLEGEGRTGGGTWFGIHHQNYFSI